MEEKDGGWRLLAAAKASQPVNDASQPTQQQQ